MQLVKFTVTAFEGNSVVIVVTTLSQPNWLVKLAITVPTLAGLHLVKFTVTAFEGNKVVIVVTTLSQPYWFVKLEITVPTLAGLQLVKFTVLAELIETFIAITFEVSIAFITPNILEVIMTETTSLLANEFVLKILLLVPTALLFIIH